MDGESPDELSKLKAERRKLADELGAAQQRMRSLDAKLLVAEQACAELAERSAIQKAHIASLEDDLRRGGTEPSAAGPQSDKLQWCVFLDDEEHVETTVRSWEDATDGECQPAGCVDDSIMMDLRLEDEAAQARCHLLVTQSDGEQAGREFPISKPVITIGRARSNDITIRDELISRTHVRLRVAENGLIVEDTGSKNGTMVNSRRIDRTVLRDGDIVTLGGKHEFRYVSVAPDSPHTH